MGWGCRSSNVVHLTGDRIASNTLEQIVIKTTSFLLNIVNTLNCGVMASLTIGDPWILFKSMGLNAVPLVKRC